MVRVNDRADERDEARQRYQELLQELRVILPGVQVLFAFLLTAPFSARFNELDELGRDLYGVALLGTALSMVMLLAPASFHRVAQRASSDRLRTAVMLTVAGMATLGVSVLVVVFVVMRFIFEVDAALPVTVVLALVIAGLWYLLPLLRGARNG
jgi:cation transport ATPase